MVLGVWLPRLSQLPGEMWEHIISYLGAGDMMRLCQVNHDFYAFLSQPHIWQRFITHIQRYDHQRYMDQLTGPQHIALVKGWAVLQHMTQRRPRDIVHYGVQHSLMRLGQLSIQHGTVYNLSAAHRMSRMLNRLHVACKQLYISMLFGKDVETWYQVRVTHTTGFHQVEYVKRHGRKRKRQHIVCELNWSRLYVSMRKYDITTQLQQTIQSFDCHWESILATQRGTLVT